MLIINFKKVDMNKTYFSRDEQIKKIADCYLVNIKKSS